MANWQIIAYDIKDTRRLSRVHRRIKKDALALQKSVFALNKTPAEVERLLQELLLIVDTSVDDIRIYPIHRLSDIWSLGQQYIATENLAIENTGQGKKLKEGVLEKLKNQWLNKLWRS